MNAPLEVIDWAVVLEVEVIRSSRFSGVAHSADLGVRGSDP